MNVILGNPEAMGQILSLARSLGGPGEGAEGSDASGAAESKTESSEPVAPDFSQLLGGLDPSIVQLGARLLRESQGHDDRNAALLAALRPFLREERRAKLDQALQIARMIRLIRIALEAMGEKGGEEGV